MMELAISLQCRVGLQATERSRAAFFCRRLLLIHLVIGLSCRAGSAAPASWAFAGGSVEKGNVRRLLSSEMIASKGGYTLIDVGSGHGVLVEPDGSIAAVRHIDTHESDVSSSQIASRSHASCPESLDNAACWAWCRAVVAPELLGRGNIAKNSCGAGSAFSFNCTCYGSGSLALLATCQSPCEDPTSQAQKQETSIDASSTSDTHHGPPPNRYFLYDVRFGFSFGAQLDALFIAMRIVSGLNEVASKACAGSVASGPTCQRWALVLPPWCAVVHWYSDTKSVPWGNLFEVKALAKEVPIIEFAEFNQHVKRANSVDMAIVPTLSKQRGSALRGEFNGWAGELSSCEAGGQTLPQMNRIQDKTSMVYSGYCDGDVIARQVKCGLLRRMSRDALQDMLLAVPRDTKSILLKHLDALPFPPPSTKTRQMQLALRPALHLENAAEDFIKRVLGGIPFIGVHLRRNEFVKEHPSSTPSAEAAAARLNTLIRTTGVDEVFVVTEDRVEFRETLRKRVKTPLYYFSLDDGATVPDYKGEEAVMLLYILGRARHFIGTSHSHFSDAVRRERRRQIRPDTSEEVFCDGLTVDGHKQTCKAA